MKAVMRKLLNQLETVILNHLYLQRDMQFFGWTLILMKFCLVTDYVRWHQDCDEDEEDQDEGRVEGPRPGSPPLFHSGDLNEAGWYLEEYLEHQILVALHYVCCVNPVKLLLKMKPCVH